jgi:MFS family permease
VTSTTSQTESAPASLGVMVQALLPFGFGYFLSYLFRAVNAVVAPELVSELQLTATDLGLLTAAYLFSFALFQIPLGILLDRYGPRRVQTVLLTLAAIGAALFSYGSSAATLAAARALIGIGVAGGLMASFKAVVLWVPEPRRALGNSLVMSLGAVGLLVSTAPMQWVVEQVGWRTAFLALAAVTLFSAFLVRVVVPDRAAAPAGGTLGQQTRAVAGIMSDRAFLALAPMLALTAGTHIAIQTLWAAPWHTDVVGYDRTTTANVLFLMAAAFFAGILLSGAIADWFGRRGVDALTVMMGFMALFLGSQLLMIIDWAPLRTPAWLVFGMSGQVAILAYPWLSSYFGTALSGRANTAMNMLIFSTAFAVQSAIGGIIDVFPRTAAGTYPVAAYKIAFGLFLALQALSVLWYLANRRHFRKA